MRTLILSVVASVVGFAGVAVAQDAQPPARRTTHVVHVMIDGLRWQEVFTGADERYMTKEVGNVEKADPLKQRWIRPTPEERRAVLMPFFWSVIAKEGQVFGNRDKGSVVDITNGIGVSYPGYAETLCGVAEPVIRDNRHIMNPNPTVFEWLNGKEAFRGRVAAFGAWNTFAFIFREKTCGFMVDDGVGPIEGGKTTEGIRMINTIRSEIPYRWGGVAFDTLVYNGALEWIRANEPRAVFLCMGETDEWAHEYDYAKYLEAAHQADKNLRKLWEMLQSMDEYRGCTTLIINPDHGRGDLEGGPRHWGDHGQKYVGSHMIWLAAMGPDIAPLGEREKTETITQNQIAATIAAVVGEDFCAAQPKAAKPVAELVSGSVGRE